MATILGRVDPIASRPTIVRAEGVHVFGADGRRYLDAVSGAFCVSLGYTRPDLVRAMTDAAGRLPFARRAAFENPEAEAYTRELLEEAGGGFARIVLTSSGSEAVDAALKLAWRYQAAVGHAERTRFAWRPGHYHGATLGALGVTGWAARRRPYEALLGGAPPASVPAAAAPVHIPAAHILETIPAAGLGASVPPTGALARLRAECDAAGALWIADEVLTGFGRCGALFGWQRLAERAEDFGAAPDLAVFGKGAGAGFAALGGVLVGARVVAALEALPAGQRFAHFQTYGGNPIACAVGRAVLAALKEERLFARVREAEPELDRALESAASHPAVREVRGLGFLRGVVLRGVGIAARVEGACRERGLLVYAAQASAVPGGDAAAPLNEGGPGADFLLLAPPLVTDAPALREIGATLRAALDAVLPA